MIIGACGNFNITVGQVALALYILTSHLGSSPGLTIPFFHCFGAVSA